MMEQEAELLGRQGLEKLYQGKFGAALELLQQAKDYCDRTYQKDRAYIAYLQQIAYCHRQLGQYEQALTQLYHAIEICDREGIGKMVGVYNHLGDIYKHIGEFDKSLFFFQEGLNILQQGGIQNDPNVAFMSYIKISDLYIEKMDFDRAMTHIVLAQEVLKNHKDPNFSPLNEAGIFSQMGICFFYKGDIDMALSYFEKGVYIFKSLDSASNESFGDSVKDIALLTSLFHIGNCWKAKKKYTKALHYYEEAFGFATNNEARNHLRMTNIFTQMGKCYREIEDFEQALFYTQRALQTCLKSSNESNLGAIYLLLGECEQKQGQHEKAVQYYHQSIAANEAYYGSQHISLIPSRVALGNAYAEQQSDALALKTYQQALAYFFENVKLENGYHSPVLKPPYQSSPELLSVLKAKAHFFEKKYLKNGNLKALLIALKNYQLCSQQIDLLRNSYKATDSKLDLAQASTEIYQAAITVAYAAFIAAQKQTKALQAANQEITDLHQGELLLTKDTKSVQNEADCLQTAFTFAEKNRSMLLLGTLQDKISKTTSNIPKILLQKEYDLRIELAFWNKKISQLKAKPAVTESEKVEKEKNIKKLQSKYFDYTLEYDQLIEQFETDYPDYYQLKHQVETVTIEILQQKLSFNTALIEYFIGSKEIYTFVITSKDAHLLQTDKPTDFEELIETFKLSIEEKDKADYCESAFELYEILIAPTEAILQGHPINHIKIIPTGILNTIPFEALLTKEVEGNVKYADLPYLLLQYDISYHYCATLWSQSLQSEPKQGIEVDESFIGFAPVYKNKQTFEGCITKGFDPLYNKENTRSVRIGEETYSELVYSEEEVKTIESYFKAKTIPSETYLHAHATTDNFLQNIGKHKYVLISAHGFYNEKQPDLTGIIFSPDDNQTFANPSDVAKSSPIRAENSPSFEKHGDVWSDKGGNVFYLSDAYNLQLNADLVVLSCCETGVGKLAKGEGVMALNRGFFYAGAKNVIYTLFKVYDEASCQLTKHLFQHILESKPYVSALKEAKRQMILQGKAPIHWAGYLLIGE
ncbi:MAG: CHAT domain-containing protein [Chitinophagales bacterium]